jgi:hypothetical protein
MSDLHYDMDRARAVVKRCCRCGQVKRLELFHRDKAKPDGRRATCAACVNGLRIAKQPMIEWKLCHDGIYRAKSDHYERTTS